MAADLPAWIEAIGTAVAAGYAAANFHRSQKTKSTEESAGQSGRGNGPMLLILFLVWGAAGFGYWDRHYNSGISKLEVISLYGVAPPYGFHMDLITDPLEKYADNYKIMAITRIGYADVDEMTDTYICKSDVYSITGKPTSIAIIANGEHGSMRFVLGVPLLIYYYAVLIPRNISPQQIRSLEDVKTLGGKLIEGKGQIVTFPKPPDGTVDKNKAPT